MRCAKGRLVASRSSYVVLQLITGSRGSIALGRCRVPTHSCRLSFQSINAWLTNTEWLVSLFTVELLPETLSLLLTMALELLCCREVMPLLSISLGLGLDQDLASYIESRRPSLQRNLNFKACVTDRRGLGESVRQLFSKCYDRH